MKTVLAKKLKVQKAAYAELDTLTSRATGARRAMTAHESRRFDALLKTIETTAGRSTSSARPSPAPKPSPRRSGSRSGFDVSR